MRKFVISLAAAGAALAIASPASPILSGQPQVVRGAPYGNAYGYQRDFRNGGATADTTEQMSSVTSDRLAAGPPRLARMSSRPTG